MLARPGQAVLAPGKVSVESLPIAESSAPVLSTKPTKAPVVVSTTGAPTLVLGGMVEADGAGVRNWLGSPGVVPLRFLELSAPPVLLFRSIIAPVVPWLASVTVG